MILAGELPFMGSWSMTKRFLLRVFWRLKEWAAAWALRTWLDPAGECWWCVPLVRTAPVNNYEHSSSVYILV